MAEMFVRLRALELRQDTFYELEERAEARNMDVEMYISLVLDKHAVEPVEPDENVEDLYDRLARQYGDDNDGVL